MNHFSMQEWVDFVRQTKAPERAGEMQKHLDDQCTQCTKDDATWRRIVEFASQEQLQQPPESSLRLVKANFALRKIAAKATGNIQLAMLVFDSAQQQLAGVRNSAVAARQLLYKSGTVCIDLHVQPKPGSDEVVVVGQLLDSISPAHGMGGVPVSLMRKGNSVSSKKTNDFGEFDFGLEGAEDVYLSFGLNNSTLVVPVPETPLAV